MKLRGVDGSSSAIQGISRGGDTKRDHRSPLRRRWSAMIAVPLLQPFEVCVGLRRSAECEGTFIPVVRVGSKVSKTVKRGRPMGRQRRILDLLAERGRLCIETIARELGEDPDRIKARVLKMRYRGLVRVITRSASLDGALIELALPALVRKVHGDAA